MGKTPVNSALRRVTGKIDGWVYRTLEGETIIARPSGKPRKDPTLAQSNQRERFRRSATYAKQVYQDPVRKAAALALALRRGLPASRLFAFLVQDFALPPVITGVELGAYHRQAGDSIDIFATDNGEVREITVTVKAADGTVLEAGTAEPHDAGWRYTALTMPPAGPLTIEVAAVDVPGNRTTQAEVVP